MLNKLRNKQQRLTKTCSRCGAKFTCIVGTPCWCEEIHIDRETLKKLRMGYLDCLCKTCLQQFSTSSN